MLALLKSDKRYKLLVVFLILAWPILLGQILGGTGMPVGSMVFSDGACPPGTTEVTVAQGRYIVATPSGGTQAGTVGSAMADLATTGANLTAVTVSSTAITGSQTGSHTHGGTGSLSAGAGPAEVSGPQGSARANTGSAGGGSSHGHGTLDPDSTGHVVPYIQLRLCER